MIDDLMTARQQEIFFYIARSIAEDGEPPVLRDIATHFGFGSRNAAYEHVQAIIKKGYLTKTSLIKQGMKITAKGRAL